MTDGKSRGFRTTQTTKELGVERIKELLSDDAVRIVDDKYFVSARSSALKMINALFTQLGNFAEVLNGETIIKKPRKSFSGKIGGGKDDICMAFLMSCIWSKEYYKYIKV